MNAKPQIKWLARQGEEERMREFPVPMNRKRLSHGRNDRSGEPEVGDV